MQFENIENPNLVKQLQDFSQSHVLQFWNELAPTQRKQLINQLETFDFQLIDSLTQLASAESLWEKIAQAAEVPPAITLAQQSPDEPHYQHARATGTEALAAGKVGMILVAGGQGTRLGFDHPKGMFPIGPISNRTLYQIHFEQVLGRSRQFGVRIPLYVMTSPPTHDETTQFLTDHQFFGMDPADVKIFCQGVMPAVDKDGKLLLETKSSVFVSPDGHGGTLEALARSGCLQDAKTRGIEHLFYGQVDNPLIQTCDPALVGYHLNSGSEMTSQVVRKTDWSQKVGNVVSIDGKVQIIEYSDLPEQYAKQTNPDGSLKLWAGSIAVHLFKLDFLERSLTQADSLPFHLANKKVPFLDASGTRVVPDQPNAIKFERFIFDLLPLAENAIVCEVKAEDGFCAVKNAPPANSETPEHVKSAISDLHGRWLQAVGVELASGITVEINPTFAADVESLKGKIPTGTKIVESTYFK
ncbi:MAG: UTP--glucose-1-phosphate uridylyltransferase [Mariniblastus sp.]